MNCINIKSPEFKALVASTGIPEYELDYKISKWQETNDSFEFPSPEQLILAVNYSLRAVRSVSENMQKMQALWNKMPDKNMFWDKIQQDYGIPKDQIALLKESEGNTLTDKLTSFLANYSYTVEINTAKESKFASNIQTSINPLDRQEEIAGHEYELYIKGVKEDKNIPTQYYSNLTVPGGTNYTENEIATPGITPSIKGHAQFATDQGIGWFRSDEQTKEGTGRIDEWDDDKNQRTVQNFVGGEPTKTRRILEVQSDLFQKGRDRKDLTGTYSENVEGVGEMVGLKERESDPKANKFLQLLNKDNNWVTFFVKSIVQDSAKKGYEKVLFPSGNTASKVEGHTTLEEFKKQKENRIKELEEENNTIDKKGINASELEQQVFNDNIYEIKNLRKELERVEKEGFAALRPIYNFYETTVANILKKQGYSPKKITDEYGNTWNEVDIATVGENIRNIYLQTQTSEIRTNEDLNTTIKNFLNKIGVSYQAVENLRDSQGNPIEGVALANMLDKVIQVVEGKAGVDTLPEEAAHFFVEMLPEDSHLFTTMFNSIEGYEVYAETLNQYKDNPLYAGNTTKLKKEAIGKLIAKHIVDGFNGEESAKNIEKAQKWWNLIWNWIVNKFKKFPTKSFYEAANQANAFAVSANMIMSGDTSALTEEVGEELYLQKVSEESTKTKDVILDVAKTLSYDKSRQDEKAKKSGYTQTDPQTGEVKDIKNRTTDLIKKLEEQRNWSKRSPEEEVRDKKAALAGDKIHAALNNIIKIYSEALQGKQVTALDKSGVTDSQYQQLKVYADNLFKQYDKEFGPGTIFLSETLVYDKKNDRAGTVDLIAIRPDGTVDIYDWKSTNLSGKSAIPYYKEENWNVQLTSYKNTLKSYGINKFGRVRVIPIATKFDKNMNLTGISVGGKNLDQVPITGLKGADVEFTGNESIDKLIETLVGRLNKIYQIKVPYGDVKKQQLKVARIEKLKASIKELQLKQTYDAFLDEANFELNYIKEAGIDSFDNDELVDARNFVRFYARIIEEGYITKEILKDNFQEFSKVQASASFVLSQLNSEFEKRAIKAATDVGVENVLEPQEESGVFARWFRSISQFEHPVIKSFYKLISRQKDKIYSESRVLFNNIESAVKELEAWGAGQGLKGLDIFKPLLKIEDGKWTGNLISKYKAEFYKRRDEAVADKDKESIEWLKQNTVFDAERFKKLREENIKTWNKIFKDDKNKNEIIKKKISDFDSKYNVTTNPTTAYGKQNFLVLPKDIWQSDEYKKVMSTPALKKFYELFTSTIKENSEYLDIKLLPSFVPSIHNDLIDGIAQNGFFSVSGLKDSFVQAITAKSDSGYGMIDETTGEFKKSIPVYYTQSISPEAKSMDLGRSLFLFANMALNHKYMSEIESSAYMLKDILERRSKTIPTDALGKPIPNKLTEKVAQVMNSNDTVDMFNKFMDYYLYGISTSGADKTIQINGNNVSTKKVFSQTLKAFSAKSLSLNILSGFANLFGGSSNVMFEGVKGRFYNNKQFAKAVGYLSSRNELAYQLIEFFDIESNSSNFEKANKLSASSLSKNLTFDKFYILQKGGDYVLENGVLLSMLQSHTLKNGKIVKKATGDKSLMEQAEIVNDKIKFPGLSEEEYGKFRRKVKYLYTTTKGNMSADDITTVKLTVFGQAMMQFKNWIPRMADERFGNLRYTQDLDTWEQGKFITTWNHISDVVHGNFKNLVTGLLANGFLGVGSGIASDSIRKAAESHYDSLKADVKAKMSREDYAAMYKANLKASALELQIILVITVLLAALKAGDDDKDPARKYFIKMANRNLQELSFFINPESAATMIGSGAKTTVPVMGFLLDIERFLSDFTGQAVGVVTFDEERMQKNKPVRKFLNLFPATNSLERLWEDLYPEDK